VVRWLCRLNQRGWLPGLALLALSVVVVTQDLLTDRTPEPGKQAQPAPTAPPPVSEWQEPAAVPIEEVERGAWEHCWVVVSGVVTPDGAHGLDWVGVSADGRQTRVVFVFHKRDFRRRRVGEVVTVEGYQRRSARGVVELVECRFRDCPPAGH
jgi:hypothetical protein